MGIHGLEKSKVLMVQDLDTNLIRPKFLANLFGCFGNILNIIVNKEKCFALVEFQTIDQADIALRKLNNLPLFCCMLKISFSQYQFLSVKQVSPEQTHLVFYENDPKSFRYTAEQS